MKDLDKIALAAQKAKGERPYFLQDKQTEQVMSIAMSLAMELSVTRERLATMEALLVENGVISQGQIDAYQPSKDEADKRSLDTQAYLARVLRILSQDVEQMTANDMSAEAAQELLTR
ncbi:hypothetical protein [Paraferrimonas sedimenticola]|uniref:Uncharacterized protein n=1 Tax=Paraferrimonas sedimenticola TaxID=375674 RepID=A0AA37RV49_9GAMM|nr:hypothetical protein [Paraferrimonas sedimenticola]GLP96260.1 hypothetical protein GCM10007895_15660 [Paraferrimonas sedimenticola]